MTYAVRTIAAAAFWLGLVVFGFELIPMLDAMTQTTGWR
jgi:hypothetical protein